MSSILRCEQINAGYGARFAVPIARLMIQKYLKGEIPANEKYLEDNMANAVILPNVLNTWEQRKSNNTAQQASASEDETIVDE